MVALIGQTVVVVIGGGDKFRWARSPVVFAVYVLFVIAVVLGQGFRQDWGWALISAIVLGAGVVQYWRWRRDDLDLPSR